MDGVENFWEKLFWIFIPILVKLLHMIFHRLLHSGFAVPPAHSFILFGYLIIQSLFYLFYFLFQSVACFHLAGNFIKRVHRGCVVAAAELMANRGV